MKTQHLKEVELSLRWLSCRETIIKSQVDEHLLKLNTSQQSLSEKRERLCTEFERFCAQAREFCLGYALLENGWQSREEEIKRQLAFLSTEKDALQKDLQSYNTQKENIPPIKEENNKILLMLEGIRSQEKCLIDQCNIEEEKVSKALDERNRVSDIPFNDPEFIKLQKELDHAKEVHLEKKCQDLQQELQQIQQSLWQKQLNRETNFPQAKLKRQLDKQPLMGNVLKVTNYSALEPDMTPSSESQKRYDQIPRDSDTQSQQEGDFSDVFMEDFQN